MTKTPLRAESCAWRGSREGAIVFFAMGTRRTDLYGLTWIGDAIPVPIPAPALALALALALAGCTLKPPREEGTTAVGTGTGTTGGTQQSEDKSGLACPTGWGRLRSADITTTSSFAAYQHRSCDRLDLMNCGPMCERMPEICFLGRPDCRPE